jgi:alkylhydroperoxidase family enzyme
LVLAAAPAAAVPSDAEAWRHLPPAEEGAGQPLPAWVRALSVTLPRTAAAMIDLDYAQRAESSLPARLRASLRCVAADANRCDYGRAYARADYVRAGGRAEDIDRLREHIDSLPEPERLALRFVRQLTEAAYSVTDAQVARLVGLYGERQVVAMVLVAAYANFQDRLLLGLGVAVEPSGPLPPVRVKFRKPSEAVAPGTGKKDTPAARGPHRWEAAYRPKDRPPVPLTVDDPEWTAMPFDALQQRVRQQIQRPQARVRIPDWETVRKTWPAGWPLPPRPMRIKWSLLCYGYQPRLTAAWLGGLRAFQGEAHLDDLYEQSAFWVVTRSLQCFY